MSKIIKNTSLYTVGNILPQAVGFILLPIYTHYLTPADYGIVNSLQVLTSILTIFFTLAIERLIFRIYFDHKTETDKKDYLGTITIAICFISSTVLLLVFLFREAVNQIFKSIEFYPYYTFAILSTFFAIFQIIPKIYFQVNEKADKFVLVSIAQFTLNAGFTLWFITGKLQGAQGMIKGELLANAIMTPLVVYISYKTINFRFKLNLFIESLKFSLPMIPGLLSAFVLNLSDRIFIEKYFTLTEVGLYSLGYKVAGLVSVLTGSFLMSYSPVFYRNANSANQTLAKKKIQNYNHLFILTVILSAFLITFFSKEAITILLNPKYMESYKIIPIISLSFIINNVTGLFSLMIYQNKKSIVLMYIGIVTAFLSILLNFLLIPFAGMYGAAVTNLIAFLCVLLLTWKCAMNYYYVPFKWDGIPILFISLASIILLFQYALSINIYLSLALKILICGLGMLVIYKKYHLKIKLLLCSKNINKI